MPTSTLAPSPTPSVSGPELQAITPQDGDTVAARTIDVSGSLAPADANTIIDIFGATALIAGNGTFTVPDVSLAEGENEIILRALRDGVEVARTVIHVHYLPIAEGRATIDPRTGGAVDVSSSDSPLSGATLSIPPHAATSTLQATITYEPEHFPNLPFGEVAVGPPVVYGPLATYFAAPVALTLPVVPSQFPPSTGMADVFVRGFGDDGWDIVSEHPALGVGGVTVMTDRLAFAPFVATVRQPLADGELLVDSPPGFATLYVDGADTGLRTPTILGHVAPGTHEAKLYLPGYNEVFEPFEMPPSGGLRLSLPLDQPSGPTPTVTFDQLVDGMTVSDSFIAVEARALLNGTPLADGRVVISINGRDTLDEFQSDGTIDGAVALSLGTNVLQVRVTAPNGNTGVSIPLHITRIASAPARVSAGALQGTAGDLLIRLSWNTADTDIDLHVFDPAGNHAWYGALGGIPGGALDRDDTDGFGPEVFRLAMPQAGTYRVAVDSFSIDSNPTVATLRIEVGGRTIFEDSYGFSSSDGNATAGSGQSGAAFWNAHTFDIGDLNIVSVEPVQCDCGDDGARFTTAADERQIRIRVEASDAIADESIRYQVRETIEQFELDTSALMGRDVVFDAAHEELMGLVNPRFSRPLTYEVVATTDGDPPLTSAPARLVQEVRSQIRQEYVDKKAFFPGFRRTTPGVDTILSGGDFTRQAGEFFSFAEFAQGADPSYAGLAVIDRSRSIANSVRTAWGKPLRLTSGWRNPRKNDSLIGMSDPNSFHQTGDAVDLNPSLNGNWPAMGLRTPACTTMGPITTYTRAQDALLCLAKKTLDDAEYDILFHFNHVHLEYDPH